MTKPSLLDPGEVLPLLGPDSVLEQPRLLSIGQICEETGLTADVIRVWERRYGFPVPVRRPSGHRRYQFEDLARLKLMTEAMARGHRPSQVVPSDEASLRQLLVVPANPRVDALYGAMVTEDAHGLQCLLVEQLSRLGWTPFVRLVLVPLLDRVNLAWAEGAIGPGQEAMIFGILEGWSCAGCGGNTTPWRAVAGCCSAPCPARAATSICSWRPWPMPPRVPAPTSWGRTPPWSRSPSRPAS